MPVQELHRHIGTEMPLDQFHLSLRRIASVVSGVAHYGACLVTCSDEKQGILRGSFERDVAIPLISGVANARERVFAVSNLCGRLEPGAFALIDDHFTRLAGRSEKLIIIEIASHVGRIRNGATSTYGQVERFGRHSPCCGALTTLLAPRPVTGTVRHPWFEQLNAFFGPVRIDALRQLEPSARMIAAAVVHAALQAESAVAEIIQDAPQTPTDVLLVSGVAVNQQWADGFLPVSCHHLHARDGSVDIRSGFSLRTTPEALHIDLAGARVRIDGGHAMETAAQVRRSRPVSVAASEEDSGVEAALAVLDGLPPEQQTALEQRLADVRRQVEAVRHDPAAWRSYSRPILRGLFRGLSIVQPEVGIASLIFEGGEHLVARQKLRELLRAGPTSAQGRQVLHDMEAELQQLNHEDAQQVLDLLLAGSRGGAVH